MSSEESTAPESRDDSDAPVDGSEAASEATAGGKGKKAKKEKAPKEPKAKKEKPPKEPKAGKAPKEPKPPKVKKPRRSTKGTDPVDGAADAVGDDLEIGWSTGDVDVTSTDGAADPDGEPVDGQAPVEGGDRPARRRTLVGAAAIGPLLLFAALFLPTDRGRHGASAMAAPATVPVGEVVDDEPVDEAPEETTPRFLVTVEQDLPATTTTLTPTTLAEHGEASHDTNAHETTGHDTGAHETGAHDTGDGTTASTAHRSSTRTSAPPPFVVTQYDREDTQLAVFVLLDGRKIELAVPVRYFHLVSVSDKAQQTFDKEVAGHLLVVDRDGRYWGADLQAVPALLYQLPSSKPLEAPTTTAPAETGAHGTTTTTMHDGGHPATGTTVHESTVHEDAEVTTPGTAEVDLAAAADHAHEGATTTGHADHAHEGATTTGHADHEATEGDHGDADTEAHTDAHEPTTTTRVREPFPLVVKGPVSDEDERVVRLLAALPGVTSVLDLGRGAVMVEGDVDLESILNVPGVLAAQPAGA